MDHLKERVDLVRNAIGPNKPFVIDPDMRKEIVAFGLDKLGMKFCHELAGDGAHDNIPGQYIMFVEGGASGDK